MNRIAIAAAIIALLMASAHAQDASNASPGSKRHGGGHARNGQQQQPTKKVDDGAYKSALKGIADPKTPSDPWGSVRANPR